MSVESRVRTAAEATAAMISQVRPLTLPPETAPAGRPARSRSHRVRRDWLVPLAAAIAVIAIAATLVAVRDLPGAGQAQPSARPSLPPAMTKPVAIPRYTAVLEQQKRGNVPRYLAVADTHTGRTLVRVPPLPGYTISGLSGAADDRTYVIDEVPLTGSKPHVWWLLRITPGTPVKMRELTRMQQPATTQNFGFAVSPNGAAIAVLSIPRAGTQDPGPLTLQTFSLVTGLPLHTWTGAKSRAEGIPSLDGTFNATLSWLSDNRTLAFQTFAAASSRSIYLLDTTSTGHSLPGNSRPFFTMPPAEETCDMALLTPDGRTAFCAGGSTTGAPAELAFTAYSTATGKAERVLYRARMFRGAVLWAGSPSQAIVLLPDHPSATDPRKLTDVIGILTPNKFTPIPIKLGLIADGSNVFAF